MENNLIKAKYNKPDFLIVGAAKAGTTSIANYLNEIPEVYIPENKELRFFIKKIIENTNPKDPLLRGIINKSILDEVDYFSTFENKTQLCGEASVHYLYHYKTAIPNILKYVGDIPIIIILRNPYDRAVSNWKYNGKDYRLFSEAIQFESTIQSLNFNSFWYYIDQGFYSNAIKEYCRNFSQVKIFIFERFFSDTQNFFNEITDFLNLGTNHKVNLEKIHNVKKMRIPKNCTLRSLYKRFCRNKKAIKILNLLFPKFMFETKEESLQRTFTENEKDNLKEYFSTEIEKVERILGYSIKEWHK